MSPCVCEALPAKPTAKSPSPIRSTTNSRSPSGDLCRSMIAMSAAEGNQIELGLQHQLHVNHIQPLSELKSHLLHPPDLLESRPPMKRHARRLLRVDAGDN